MKTVHGARSVVFAIGFVLLLAVSACGTQLEEPRSGQESPDLTLRLAVSDALPHLDPFLQNTAASNWMLYGNVFEGLLRYVDGEPQPSLATAWAQVDDLTWTFDIRGGATFHDGSPLTSAEVAASFERTMNHPESAIAGRVAQIRSITARDADTVEIRLLTPSQAFLRGVAMIPIVSNAESDGLFESLIATGPYTIVDFIEGTHLMLERHTGYWGKEPQVDRAEIFFEGDEDARVQLLLDGSVDLVNQIPPPSIAAIEARADLWVESSLGTSLRILVLNLSVPPFDDPRIPEAIDLALDRETLVEVRYEGHARVAGQLAGPTSAGHIAELASPPRNLERARALVAEAARSTDLSLRLYCGSPAPAEAITIEAQLEEAGFDVEIVGIPWSDLYPRIQAGEVPFVYQGWTNYSGDPASTFEEVIHSYSPDSQLGRSNHGRYSNPEADRLIEASIVTGDPALRRQILEGITRIVAKDRPIIPLVRPLNIFGLRRDLNWVAPPTAALTISEMSFER